MESTFHRYQHLLHRAFGVLLALVPSIGSLWAWVRGTVAERCERAKVSDRERRRQQRRFHLQQRGERAVVRVRDAELRAQRWVELLRVRARGSLDADVSASAA